MDYPERIDALADVWAAWARTTGSLDDAGWAAPSRCAGWDVAALAAHVGLFPGVVLHAPPPPQAHAEPVTAAEILAGFNEPGGVAERAAGDVADHAVAAARAAGSEGLVATFTETAPSAVAALRAHAADEPVPWPAAQAVTTWGDGIRIMILESVVHLLDALDALGRRPDVPAAGLRDAAHLLADVAGPLRFVEAATGRTGDPVLPVLR